MTQAYDPLASVQAAGPPGTISFIYGLPDPGTFPAGALSRSARRVLAENPELALQYGPEQGFGPLIDYLRGKLHREEGLAIERPQIMLTGGSCQALDHVCTLFGRPGDLILVEAPTYHESIQLFRDHGLEALQVQTDEGGLVVEALAERLRSLSREGRRARFLYTIPTYQNPSGNTLVAERRSPIVELAERYDLLILEDDVYRDLAYEGQVPASLFALAGEQRVLRIGSFSKLLAPGVRLGWLMGPEGLIQKLIDSGLRRMGGGANPLMANILADYCRQGLLEPHIEELRRLYAQRRDAMLSALELQMPSGTSWSQPRGGFFVWLSLTPGLQATQAAERARAAKVLVPVGDPFFAEWPTGQYLRLAFSFIEPDKIAEGIATLADVVASEQMGKD